MSPDRKQRIEPRSDPRLDACRERLAPPAGGGRARRVPLAAGLAGAAGAAMGVVVLLLASDRAAQAADADAGEVAYAPCAVCHGDEGRGRADGTFPRIAGQHATVVVKQIEDIRSGRRGNPIMASHVAMLTDPEEMADIAAYVERLSPGPREAPARAEGAERGALLYRRDCARCHGAHGEGSAEGAVPVVAGQHSAYLLRQLRAIAGSRRKNAHPGMVEVVFDYPDEDLRAVVAHLSQLPWPGPAAER
ncbi:MAG: c-type cytochrome [Myxococcota bacterium]